MPGPAQEVQLVRPQPKAQNAPFPSKNAFALVDLRADFEGIRQLFPAFETQKIASSTQESAPIRGDRTSPTGDFGAR